jgi:hypothetical protein
MTFSQGAELKLLNRKATRTFKRLFINESLRMHSSVICGEQLKNFESVLR